MENTAQGPRRRGHSVVLTVNTNMVSWAREFQQVTLRHRPAPFVGPARALDRVIVPPSPHRGARAPAYRPTASGA